MRKRAIENWIFLLGGIWTIFISVLTIFGYSSWFQHIGSEEILSTHSQVYQNVNILNNLTKFIVIYGLFNLFFGIANLIVARKVDAASSNTKLIKYLIIWVIIEFISFDLVGVCIYSIGIVLYYSRRKALEKIRKRENANEKNIRESNCY